MGGHRLGAGAIVLASWGCFSGDNTLGAICGDDLDCGARQTCTNEVCGYCGDAVPQRGELCTTAAAELTGAPVASPGDVLALDHDRDGRLDLLTRGADGTPELWGGDGAGGWTLRMRLPAGGTAGAMRLAALDDDDAIDLVVVDELLSAIVVGHGEGEGWSFAAPVVVGGAPVDVAVAGLGGAGPAWVAWVDEQGLWRAPVDPQARTLGEPVMVAGARAQWLGDPAPLDADAELDLAVADVDGRALEVWLGDGAGGLTMSTSLALEGRPTEVVVFDADGEGDLDVLVPDEDGGVTVILSDGEGGLEITERVTVPGPARGVAVADLDRDTGRDLVVTSEGEVPVWALLSRGNRHPDRVALPVDGAVGAVVALDVDRDRLTELLVGPREGAAPLRIMEVAP